MRQRVPLHRVDLVRRFGCSASHVLTDPRCERFSTPGVDGVIPYRRSLGCLVAIGDPVCAPGDAVPLAEAFRRACAARGQSTVYAAATERFAARMVERGYASIEFGEELIFDPRRDPQAGGRGRELRKKVMRARRAGVDVREYRPERNGDGRAPDRVVELALEEVARAWLDARRGPQVFISPVLLFAERAGRRWFYARAGASVIGVLSLLRLDARSGWLLEHLLAHPSSPQGTTELLVTSAFAALGDEGCGFATFGPSTLPRLGRTEGVGRVSRLIGHAVFTSAGRLFALDALSRYRRKFQASGAEPSFLLFCPARIGPFAAAGLLRAFNVSMRW